MQKLRFVLSDTAGIELPPPARRTIDLEGRIVKDGVLKALRDRQNAITDLVHAIREYWRLAETTPLTLQGRDCALAIEELNKAIDRARVYCNDPHPIPCEIPEARAELRLISDDLTRKTESKVP